MKVVQQDALIQGIEMIGNMSVLHIVRAGSDITFSSLKVIGNRILDSFRGTIREFQLNRHKAPVVDSIDAYFLTRILHEEYGGHVLGITDAELVTDDEDEFYKSIFGGKNPQNDVAVVSTKKLCTDPIDTQEAYEVCLDRTLKVSLHEVGHNLGLADHASFKTASDGYMCPMSRGESNKFGHHGYVRAVIDGRGVNFCDDCLFFLRRMKYRKHRLTKFVKDSLASNMSIRKRMG